MDEDVFNEIEEITNSEKEVVEIFENIEATEEEDTKKKKKNKKPSWFSKLPKKKKIIFITVLVVLVLGIVATVLFLFVFNKEEDKEKTEKLDIVIEKNNYRYENGTLVFLDSNDKEIGTYTCEYQDQNLCMIASYNVEENLNVPTYLNEEGEEIKFDTPVFMNRYVIIFDNENIDSENLTLYDLEKQEVLGVYVGVKRYDDKNVYLIDENGKYGLVNFEGESITNKIAFEYDYLGHISGEEKIAFKAADKSGLLNLDGSKFKENLTGTVFSYNDEGLVIVELNNTYKITGLTTEDILTDSYSYMTLKDNYIYYVNNNKLYVRLSSGEKLFEEGIELLEGTVFEDITVYDESYNLVSSDLFIEAELGTNNLEITVGDTTTSHNIYEASISANYDYVSYFGGNLYIYSDANKEEEYKMYECTNKNSVTSESTTFDNCFIATESKLLNRTNAKDTLGLIPIYGNKYVFINDMKIKSTNDNIYLVDLESNTKVNSDGYYQVDVGYYNETNNIISADASNLVVMAQKSDKKYGLLKLTNTTVAPFFEDDANGGSKNFKYSTIQLVDSVYYTKDTTGVYRLFDVAGEEITNESVEIKNEIVDYSGSYLKVKSSTGKYLVYKTDGTIVSNELTNIKLGEDKYLGVTTTDKVEVYTYADGKTNILSVSVPLLSADITFVDNTTAGFEIIFKDSEQKTIGTYQFKANGEEV